jgi:hypothetical protein
MPQFFETRMGQRFYEGTMPDLVRVLKELNATVASLQATLVVAMAQQQISLERPPTTNVDGGDDAT